MTSIFAVTDNEDILALQPRLTAEDAGVRRIALIDLADLEEPDGLLWLVDRLRQDPAEREHVAAIDGAYVVGVILGRQQRRAIVVAGGLAPGRQPAVELRPLPRRDDALSRDRL